METFLVTERLRLRPFTEADAGHVHALDDDPAVMRFINGGRPCSRDTVRRETLPRLMRTYDWPPGRAYWAAEEKDSGRFAGWFELRPLDAGPDEAELGYRLRTRFWGQGYATEGARALIRKAFTDLGLRRVMAQTMAVNAGSRRVMEKSGLTYVQTFFHNWPEAIDGSEHGDVEYALARDEWLHRVPE
ncbi:GNAT family N-acetyltransferase [Sphaerisporangium siamense]|uniref:RimJ/RimL family protein N-acetyltransferase n=1 Tax=Sphaerisporangium siamense TaxID=795645 RepID=A0A7W7G8S8_9ACTN|nr:GNAT family N-acetyltransferase [Sphaerisporangium siamense]MBB4702098.1 RimJ/RimL family protein N-acetyltransferase [Sphaerisporangium siamense]